MFDQQVIPQPEIDTEYRTFKMQDFEHRRSAPLLVQIDYLCSMFDLTVQNELDKQIVITLTEKEVHFTQRQNG